MNDALRHYAILILGHPGETMDVIQEAFNGRLTDRLPVHLAVTVPGALDRLQSGTESHAPVAVVFVDHQPPVFNGIDAAVQIQDMHPDLGIIICLNSAEFPHHPPCTASPRNAVWMPKPIDRLFARQFAEMLMENYHLRHRQESETHAEPAGVSYIATPGIDPCDASVQFRKQAAIGALAGGLAHDFNNLLTIVMGNLQLALMDAEPGTQVYSDLEETFRAAKRGSGVTQRLLLLSRRQSLQPEETDLNREAEQALSKLINPVDTGMTVRREFAEAPLPVTLDPAKLEMAMEQIIDNSKEAMNNQGHITVRTFLTESGEYFPRGFNGRFAAVEITNSGPPIPAEHLDRVTEPFFTTKKNVKGAGFGLAIAYGIMLKHCGWLSIQNRDEGGVRVTLYFPVNPCR